MIRGFLLATFLILILSACVAARVGSQGPMRGMDEGMMQRHMAPIPEEYAGMTNPVPANADSLERGKTTYETYCASCHGAVVWFVRRTSAAKQQETAVEILERRFAAVEISSEEFEEMKRQLSE